MLSQSIQNAKNIADNITRTGRGSGPVTICISHAQKFDAEEIPLLNSWQVNAENYAKSAQQSVQSMLASLQNGKNSSDLMGELETLKSALETLAAQADDIENQMGSFRTMFNTDSVQLAQYVSALQADVTKNKSLQAHYEAERASIQKRIDIINATSFFNPFVKLASELFNLVSKGKSTEASANQAGAAASKYATQMNQARQTEAVAEQLRSSVSSLSTSVQDTRNAVTIIEGKFANETMFINGTTDGTAILYLNALNASMQQLENLAA